VALTFLQQFADQPLKPRGYVLHRRRPPDDELSKRTDPARVTMERDCGSAIAGGGSPREYLKQDPRGSPCAWERLRPSGLAIVGNLKHSFVEQEEYDIPAKASPTVDAACMRRVQATLSWPHGAEYIIPGDHRVNCQPGRLAEKLIILLFAAISLPVCGNLRAQGAGTSPQVWYVSGKGSDSADGKTAQTAFATLQHAANLTRPGDTVDAMNGTYADPGAGAVLDIETPGTAGRWITFTAYPGAKPVIRVGGRNWNGIMVGRKASYIAVTGFTVIGDSAVLSLPEAQKLGGEPALHPEFNDNCISVGSNPATPPYPTHIRIENNTVEDCPGGGIVTMYADYVTISGNTISNIMWYGAYGGSAISNLASYDSNPADTATPYKMIVLGNVIRGAEEFVPWVADEKRRITDGEGIIIDSNHGSAYDKNLPFGPYTGRTLVANNVVYDGGSSAVWVYESGHVDVVNNSTFNNNLNQESESGRGEIGVNDANDVRVFNNIMYAAKGGNPFAIHSACPDCIVDYNLYFGGANAWHGFGANGPHDRVADPLYVAAPRPTLTGNAAGTAPQPSDLRNAPPVDLRLRTGSPAIGAGASSLPTNPPVFAPDKDNAGKLRGASKGYDLGAYAFR
jgi:parallel beta-helix repeat protein